MPGKPRPAKRPSSYHHGDLKAALVEHAVAILRAEGPAALTLRGVARAAGVSEAAPYRHFADRRELVAAVAEDGFRKLQEAMFARVGQASGREGLKGFALGYVDFALANAAQYRVMFGPEVARTDDLPALRETSRGVLGFVAEGIQRLQAGGLVGPGDPWSMAVAIWGMLHGIVMLTLDGVSEGVAPPLDVLLQDATRIMMFGMAGKPESPPG
ncbi:MAG TPA: TetR/AcrR family transcriptional regulator [Gemmatimonadaceae bacterium]|nr:TetR/AcrR family transcriptional regulator [Gemmatimonadaceae bacterium]